MKRKHRKMYLLCKINNRPIQCHRKTFPMCSSNIEASIESINNNLCQFIVFFEEQVEEQANGWEKEKVLELCTCSINITVNVGCPLSLFIDFAVGCRTQLEIMSYVFSTNFACNLILVSDNNACIFPEGMLFYIFSDNNIDNGNNKLE